MRLFLLFSILAMSTASAMAQTTPMPTDKASAVEKAPTDPCAFGLDRNEVQCQLLTANQAIGQQATSIVSMETQMRMLQNQIAVMQTQALDLSKKLTEANKKIADFAKSEDKSVEKKK